MSITQMRAFKRSIDYKNEKLNQIFDDAFPQLSRKPEQSNKYKYVLPPINDYFL